MAETPASQPVPLSTLQERNAMARQCADLRDELATMRQERDEARIEAARWGNWRDAISVKIAAAGIDVDTDLPDAHELIERVRDDAYEMGYAAALNELGAHWHEVISPWAKRQGVAL